MLPNLTCAVAAGYLSSKEMGQVKRSNFTDVLKWKKRPCLEAKESPLQWQRCGVGLKAGRKLSLHRQFRAMEIWLVRQGLQLAFSTLKPRLMKFD